ncbi:MAG TPA: hypothetical protein VFL79_15065 [Terriglobia bacterium]|nr:hypothetical protein [Terriglobia bacterium]
MNDCHISALTRTLTHQDLECTGSRNTFAGAALPGIAAALLVVSVFALWQAPRLHAQDRKNKMPIVGKLTSPNDRQAYSGKIQSVDLKEKILNVDSLHGQESEIFPFKKNVRIESLGGGRMDIKSLQPGATVLIYFNQKSGERTIRNIVVLSSGKEQARDKPAPSS